MVQRSIALLLLTVASTAGYKCLFIGHSFFSPIARRLPGLAASAAGVTHEQSVVSSGGESGTPSRLWENPQKRNQIQSRGPALRTREPAAAPSLLFCSLSLTCVISCHGLQQFSMSETSSYLG